MKEFILTVLAMLLMFCAIRVNAQVDPHFSQYYAYPLWLNPALTGVVDGNARLTANYKDQWTGLDNGFKTVAISGDFRTSDKMALGFNILDQKAGAAGYNYLSGYGSFAYQVPVSANGYHKLSFGVQAGLIYRGIDVNKLQMDDQYNPTLGYDPGMASGENFTSTSAAAFDANAGVFYYDGTPSGKINVFAGFSAGHLAAAKDPFANGGMDSKIPMRYTFHGGLRLFAGDFMDLTPHVIYMRQQNSQLKAAGLNVEFSLDTDCSLTLGGLYRLKDAAVGSLGLNVKSLVIGVSYDYTTSSLQKSANVRGGYEVSLSYVFKRRLSGRSQVCPRL